MSSPTSAPTQGRRLVGLLARWETLLLVVLIVMIVIGSQLSRFFLTPGNFANLLAALMEVAIMALPMTLIVIAGEIDLSVESMAGLSSAVLGFLWAAGVPLPIAVLLGHRDGRPRRADERPVRGARRPAVAGRHARHARPVPGPRPDRPRARAASATSRPSSPRSASATSRER